MKRRLFQSLHLPILFTVLLRQAVGPYTDAHKIKKRRYHRK